MTKGPVCPECGLKGKHSRWCQVPLRKEATLFPPTAPRLYPTEAEKREERETPFVLSEPVTENVSVTESVTDAVDVEADSVTRSCPECGRPYCPECGEPIPVRAATCGGKCRQKAWRKR